MGGDPVGEFLGPGGLDVGVRRGSEHCHEDLGETDFAALGIDDSNLVAAVVDEAFLAGRIDLAHKALQALAEGLIEQAELAVAVGGPGMGVGLLLPQQHEGHPGAFDLLMEVAAIEWRVGGHERRCAREQACLERRVVQVGRQRPGQARGLGALDILCDRALGYPAGPGDPVMGEPCFVFQSQNVFDLTHGLPRGGHVLSLKKSGRITRGMGNPALSDLSGGAILGRLKGRSRWIGIRGHLRSESAVTMNRNRRSRSIGMCGHHASEYAHESLKTHFCGPSPWGRVHS